MCEIQPGSMMNNEMRNFDALTGLQENNQDSTIGMNTDMPANQTTHGTLPDLSSVSNEYGNTFNPGHTGQERTYNDGTVNTAGGGIDAVKKVIDAVKEIIDEIKTFADIFDENGTKFSEIPGESPADAAPASEAPGESPADAAPTSEAPGGSPVDAAPTSEAPGGSPVDAAPASEAPGGSPVDAAPTSEAPGEMLGEAAQPVADLQNLPPLSMEPTVQKLKNWVSETYDLFPQFKEIYEGKLGLTKEEALAFHYADMSLESGKDGYWQMDLETGQGGPGHAWGPFQAAVTNFSGGGYDDSILQETGLATPNIQSFKDPQVSTYAGMNRLAEGVEQSMKELGPDQPAEKYLLGSMAHHNTGHVDSANDSGWLESYGNEGLRLMDGYLTGHMTDSKAFWTNEPF
jgi:hypothetical protein